MPTCFVVYGWILLLLLEEPPPTAADEDAVATAVAVAATFDCYYKEIALLIWVAVGPEAEFVDMEEEEEGSYVRVNDFGRLFSET